MKTMFAAVSAAAIALASGTAAGAAGKPDDGLYSMYELDGGSAIVSVCGQFGCGFLLHKEGGHFCAVLESVPSFKDGVMTRDIYLLDKREANNEEMILSVFRRTDAFNGGTNATFVKDISLGINGGSNANCLMVAGPKYVVLGTDHSSHAVKVSKKSLKASQVADGPTTLLSVDSRGYVSISDTAFGGYKIMDPKGSPLAGGGIAAQQAGSQTATIYK